MSDSNGAGPVVRVDANGNVLRSEQYYNDGYGGGNSIRGNYSSPFMGGKIDLTARYGVNDWHNINRQTAPDVLRESYYDNDSKSGEVGVVYTRPLNEKLKLETRFIHEFEDFDNLSTSRERDGAVISPEKLFSANGEGSETILRGLIRYERSPAMDFEAGGEVAYNMLETVQAYSVGGVAVPLPSASVKVEETRGELFGKATWRINPKWSLESGLRLESSTISQSGDASQEKSFFFAKPRLLATWTPMANTQVRARFERTVGQLDFDDFAASAEFADENVFGGNVNLSPESRWVSELTFEKRFWGEGIVSLGLRHDEITDAIDVIPLDGGYAAVGNIGDGTLDQLALNVTIPTDKLGLSGGKFGFRNTWNKTEVTDPHHRREAPHLERPRLPGRHHLRAGHHLDEAAMGRRLDSASGPERLPAGSDLGLARHGLLRAVGRVQADPDPVDPRPGQHLERLQRRARRLRRPRHAPRLLCREPFHRPAHLLADPRAQDLLRINDKTPRPVRPHTNRTKGASPEQLKRAAPPARRRPSFWLKGDQAISGRPPCPSSAAATAPAAPRRRRRRSSRWSRRSNHRSAAPAPGW